MRVFSSLAPSSVLAAEAHAGLACRSVDEVGALVRRVYGEALWERIRPADAKPHAAAPVHSHQLFSDTPLTAPSPPAPAVAARSPLLHVTSLFRPRSHGVDLGGLADLSSAGSMSSPLSPSDCLYTLQVCGPDAPRHPLDRFALSLARSLAAEVLYSGKVLREEAQLRCDYDAAFAPGLAALRLAHGLPVLPAVSVLTRATLPEDSLKGVPLEHPLLDHAAAAEQPITLCHAHPALGDAVVRRLQRRGDRVWRSAIEPDVIEVELGALLHAAHDVDTNALYPVLPAPLHPHKRIRFRCTHMARTRDAVTQMQQRLALFLQARSPHAPPFLCHLSVEAGPQVTRALYGLARAAAADVSTLPSSLPAPPASSTPVQTLLLSVYRGALRPEHYRRTLVYPSEHTLAKGDVADESCAVGAAALLDLPPPSLTLPFLARSYRLVSEYRCPRDPSWSFCWLERREDA